MPISIAELERNGWAVAMPNPNEPTRPGEPPRPPPFEPPRPQPPQPRPPPIEVPQRPPIEVPETPPIEVPETPPRGRRVRPPGAYGPILCDTRGPRCKGCAMWRVTALCSEAQASSL